MSNERHQIHLREAGPGSPPDLLDRIKDAIEELFDCSVSASGNYLKGKSEQEVAKAQEIKAQALAHLGNLEIERQRLLAEKQQISLQGSQKMYELKTQRLEAVVNSLIKLKNMGAQINIDVLVESMINSLNE